MSVHVLLVRHGQSAWNHERRLTGWTDVALSDLGRDQARALRPKLEALGHTWTGVWSSDLQRAAETARLAWGDATPDRRLRELDFGDLEGARWDELDPSVVASFRSVEGLAAPGGESFVDLRTRVEQFLDELPAGRHLVFCHGGVIRSVASPLGLQGFVGNVATVELDWTSRTLGAVDPGDVMNTHWLLAGTVTGVMAFGGPAGAQDTAREPAGAADEEAAPIWLAWRWADDGLRTAWLTNDPDRGYRVVATAPGRFVAHAGTIWEIGTRAVLVAGWDPWCVMADEDVAFDDLPPHCALSTVVVTTEAREVGGDGRVTLPAASDGGTALCELSQTDDIVGSLGPWVFVRSCAYEYSCFAAHGAVTCEAHVLNLAAGRVDGIEAVRDAGDVDGALREQAWSGASDEVQWMADDATSLSLVGVWPAWREDGRLQVRLQYAGASCYACSDGAWSSYTESVDVGSDEVPELLRGYRHLPAPVRAWLEAEGAWPGGRFGFSELR